MKRLLAALCAALPSVAAAQNVRVAPVAPVVAPLGMLGAAAVAPRLGAQLSVAPTLTLAPLASPSLTSPTLVLPRAAAPAVVAAAPAAAAVAEAAPAPTQARAMAAASQAQPTGAPKTLTAALTERVETIQKAGGAQAAPAAARVELDRIFSGAGLGANAVSEQSGRVVSDEGVELIGRAPDYYLEAKRLVEKYRGRVDFSESLDVMDDSYADAWAKLEAVQLVAAKSQIDDHNTHLDGTLLWVDGVLNDHGRRVAVNTHRVYFHHAANPRSEVQEGLKRVNGYLKEVVPYFSRGGKAEQALGRLDQVQLVFDTRGYAEIKQALKAREAEVARASGGRIRFSYLDEMTTMPKDAAETRVRLNQLVKRYRDAEGLGKIIEGVVYGRYVGMLLELKTVEHYLNKGYDILQSGRELFDKDGMYVTELDAVVRDRASDRVTLVEAKSARVPIPFEDALKEKVVRKLETYAKYRAELEKEIGHKVDEVTFSFDVGRNKGLIPYLQSRAGELSAKYGFKVSFLFLDSGPEKAEPQGKPAKKHRR